MVCLLQELLLANGVPYRGPDLTVIQSLEVEVVDTTILPWGFRLQSTRMRFGLNLQ